MDSVNSDTRPDIQTLKRSINLVDLIQRAGVKLKRQSGREYAGLCPFHVERSPSFTVYEKRGDWKFTCFGCGAKGDVFDFVMQYYGYNAQEAYRHLTGDGSVKRAPAGMRATPGVRGEDAREAERTAQNFRTMKGLWATAERVPNHPMLKRYLESRGIHGPVPDCLWFHPDVEHFDGDTKKKTRWPAMLAPILGKHGRIIALHRTYLAADCSGKAPVSTAKKVLGPMAGGFIPLYPAQGTHLNIVEGIETALSIREMRPQESFWTCVALGNMKNVPIPHYIGSVRIWADNDMKDPEPGKPDPRDQIKQAAKIYRAAKPGRKVTIAWPPKGLDFNDCLIQGLMQEMRND